jgi:gliding motility-associated-like protein
MTIKGKILVSILGILPLFGYSQNLVPNPGFELINDCNVDIMDHPIEGFIDSWFTYNYSQNTVDVFNTCFPIPQIQPPNTIRGFSYPHIGDGMIGVCYAQESNYREAASVQLTSQLVKDSAYCVSFWVKNSRIENMYYWADPIGVLFTNSIITQNEVQTLSPHVKSTGKLDQNEWVEVSDYYIASGGETYLNVGFFGSEIMKYQNMPYEPGGNKVPFYFIDDVSVIQCNKDSLLNVTFELPNVFTPNGDGDNDLYSIKQQNIKTLEVVVFNRWGEQIAQYDGKTTQWDGKDTKGEEVSDGVYFVKAAAETTFGEPLQKQQFVHIFRLTD